MSNTRLAIVCTHPIQYYAPLFQILSKKVELHVFYTTSMGDNNSFDPGFNQLVRWDIPLLSGYTFTFTYGHTSNFIKAYDPNKILVYGWPFNDHLKIMKLFRGKIWFCGDSTLTSRTRPWKILFKTLALKLVFAGVEKAFYVGTNNKQYYLRYGLHMNQLKFLPHAVDNFRFSNVSRNERHLIRDALGIKVHEIAVLYAGKFTIDKNLLILIEAFKKLSYSHTHLILAGDGPLRSDLEKKATGRKNIHFLPFQNQSAMPRLYQNIDLFCLPSVTETWGLCINEAMAAGKAVFVSDRVGCAIDLVKDSNAIFKHNDLADLESKLAALLVNKAALYQLGKANSTFIKDWSFQKQAEVILTELGR